MDVILTAMNTKLHHSLILGLGMLLAFVILHSSFAAEEQVFFAFDDHNITWQHNLKLTLETVTKHPANPVLRRGPPGAPDHGHAKGKKLALRVNFPVNSAARVFAIYLNN